MRRILIVGTCLLMTVGMVANSVSDKTEIEALIEALMKGVDEQNGDMILKNFRENATIQATNQGNIISVEYKQFAAMHSSKKFGGRDRKVKIESVDTVDGILGTAKVVAYDSKVHYTYYLNFSKVDGKWLIQSFLQHSKLLE